MHGLCEQLRAGGAPRAQAGRQLKGIVLLNTYITPRACCTCTLVPVEAVYGTSMDSYMMILLHNSDTLAMRRAVVEKELDNICEEILGLLDQYLVPSATTTEAAVFYLKVSGGRRCSARRSCRPPS